MIHYTQGNLLNSSAEALVNTVNTLGVMGKGIALMFKERFPANMQAYAAACKTQQVQTGQMFITENHELVGPKWIVNFPTKQHWRNPSKLEWITQGLQDLRRFLIEQQVKSIAIPPLGAGNGGLDWLDVKPLIIEALADLPTEIYIYEPTAEYQNVTKPQGVTELTPERAMITELIRRYSLLGIECSLLEAQKLAWFLERAINLHNLPNRLKFNFIAHNYGPYSNNLSHLLNKLDGTYIQASKRIPDTSPLDTIQFINSKKEALVTYLEEQAASFQPALQLAIKTLDGFESPFGMELLATVDWLITKENCQPNLESIKAGLANWPAGKKWAQRKQAMFDDRSLSLALRQLELLEVDMKQQPSRIKALQPELISQLNSLVGEVEVDLAAPLLADDE